MLCAQFLSPEQMAMMSEREQSAVVYAVLGYLAGRDDLRPSINSTAEEVIRRIQGARAQACQNPDQPSQSK